MQKKVFRLLQNKYLLLSLGYLTWMLFFNNIDIPFMLKTKSKLRKLQAEAVQVKEANTIAAEAYLDLTTNKATLEKFARERYYMKKDHEDLYVIKLVEKEED